MSAAVPFTAYRLSTGQTDGRTDTVPLHRRSPLEAGSVKKPYYVQNSNGLNQSINSNGAVFLS